MPEDSSDTSVGEKEVTQPSEPSENEMTSQQLKRSERIQKPNPKYVDIAIIEDEVKEPETYVETSQNTAWHQAMEKEIIGLEQNQTCELIPRSEDIKSISCKWAHKIMCLSNGSIERYKTQPVAQGFCQQYGLDYDETFSSVAKITIVQVPPALVNKIENFGRWI